MQGIVQLEAPKKGTEQLGTVCQTNTTIQELEVLKLATPKI